MEALVIAGLVLALAILAGLTLPRIVCPWRELAALHKFASLTGLHYQCKRTLGMPRSGRATGTCRGRTCTIEASKQKDADTYTRFLVSVDNRSSCSFDLIRRPASERVRETMRAREPFQVIHSAPPDLGRAAIDAGELDKRAAQFPRQIRASGYHLSLSGRLLRLEHWPGRLCFRPIDQEVTGLQVLLGALCDAAEAVERAGAAPAKPAPIRARAR